MRMIIPIGLLTIAAVPLIGFTEEHSSVVHETVVTKRMTSDDLPAGIPAEFRDQILKAMASGDSQSRMSFGDMGEMIFSVSTDFDGMHGHDHDRDEHDHHEDDHHEDDHHDGQMIELDLGELSGGQVQGHIVIDLADMMRRQGSGRDGSMHRSYEVEMVIEDDDWMRMEGNPSEEETRHVIGLQVDTVVTSPPFEAPWGKPISVRSTVSDGGDLILITPE